VLVDAKNNAKSFSYLIKILHFKKFITFIITKVVNVDYFVMLLLWSLLLLIKNSRSFLKYFLRLSIELCEWILLSFLSSRYSFFLDNCYMYTLFLYTYTLLFIHVHSYFDTHTSLFIKLARSHARCTRNKLVVLQHKSFIELLSWSSAFDTCKHYSNRAIFDVDYHVWNERFFKKLRFWCSSKRASKTSLLISSLRASLLIGWP
jgi:hypothetical protein